MRNVAAMMNEFDMMQDIERVLVPEDEIHGAHP